MTSEGLSLNILEPISGENGSDHGMHLLVLLWGSPGRGRYVVKMSDILRISSRT